MQSIKYKINIVSKKKINTRWYITEQYNIIYYMQVINSSEVIIIYMTNEAYFNDNFSRDLRNYALK